VAAVDPTALTRAWLSRNTLPSSPAGFLLVGAGKAAARMAAGCEAALGAERLRGLVIVADGCEVPLASIDVRAAGHPLPDARGAAATADLCKLVETAPGPVLCVISGGASALLVAPRPPVTLAEKLDVNRALLACGAEIGEFNAVRKHLSAVKGGALLRRTSGRPMITLALSDVVGDDPSTIGSGPTTPDATTFADAMRVVRKYGIATALPSSVRDLLARGCKGRIEETLKPGDPAAGGAQTVVIGNNALALRAAAAKAMDLGYEPLITTEPLVGDTTVTARQWLRGVRTHIEGRRCCAIAGGETTVAVRGAGQGGRNQEFALALAEPISGGAVAVLSAGSDGIDGPTDAAGAFVDGESSARAQAMGLDPSRALAANDSYGFFDRLGDLFRCGPTGTNVIDIKLAVGLPSEH